MVSVTINTPPMSTSPSIHSSFSQPKYSSYNNSCERLIPAKKPSLPKSNLRYSGPRTTTGSVSRQVRAARRMSSNGGSTAVDIEQKKSYGIGGAGNIRRPSEVIYPQRTNPDGTRRRSSVWSSIMSVSPGSSPDGKRMTLLNLFGRRGSTAVGGGSGEEWKEGSFETAKKDGVVS